MLASQNSSTLIRRARSPGCQRNYLLGTTNTRPKRFELQESRGDETLSKKNTSEGSCNGKAFI